MYDFEYMGTRVLVTPTKNSNQQKPKIQNNFSCLEIFKKSKKTKNNTVTKSIIETAVEQAQNQTRLEQEKKKEFAMLLAKVITSNVISDGIIDEKKRKEIFDIVSSVKKDNKFVYKKSYEKFSHTIDQTRIMMDEEKEKTNFWLGEFCWVH